jgi:Tfp pilus assembly protein PilN
MGNQSGPLLPNFNTLPSPYQPKQISSSKLIAIPSVVAAVAAIVLLTMTIQNVSGSIDKMQSDLETVNTLLTKKQAEKKTNSAKIAELEQKISNTETGSKNYEVALKSFYQNGDTLNSDLKATVNNLIPDLDLQQISLDKTHLALAGSADTEKEVFNYIRKLDSTGRFHEITINNMARTDAEEGQSINGTMSFNLGIKLEENR